LKTQKDRIGDSNFAGAINKESEATTANEGRSKSFAIQYGRLNVYKF